MTRRWCVNFDLESVFQHGLADGMWLMQYQYSHGGYDFQGHRAQIAATSANWKILMGVEAGDWFLAYLRKSTFYAVGEVIEPRLGPRHSSAPQHADTVARTIRERRHQFLDGVVRYSDAAVLYEDFADPWTCPADQTIEKAAGQPKTRPKQPTAWQFPQRIDVREWEHVIPDGVQVDGLSSAVRFPAFRRAMFEIPEEFFDRALARLKRATQRPNIR